MLGSTDEKDDVGVVEFGEEGHLGPEFEHAAFGELLFDEPLDGHVDALPPGQVHQPVRPHAHLLAQAELLIPNDPPAEFRSAHTKPDKERRNVGDRQRSGGVRLVPAEVGAGEEHLPLEGDLGGGQGRPLLFLFLSVRVASRPRRLVSRTGGAHLLPPPNGLGSGGEGAEKNEL
jgi:hypothetical protein